MRRFINLCERHDYILRDDPEMVLRYVQHWESDERVGDGGGSIELTPGLIADAQKALRRVFAPEITIYRAMEVSPYRLTYDMPLGKCWSYERSKAVSYNGRAKWQTLLFTATVDEKHVDWVASVALHPGGEAELRLDIDAKVKLIKIEDEQGNLVREDLFGQTFDAWHYV